MKLSEIEKMSSEELNKLYAEEKRYGDTSLLISLRVEMRKRLKKEGLLK